MTTLSKLSLLAGVLILSLSCGPAKTVQYVYVDNPVYSPAPQTYHEETSADNRKITVLNSPSSNSAPSTASQSPRERLRKLADMRVYGAYRGYGSYQSTDEDLAIDMAQTNALAQLGSRAIAQITRALENVTKGSNSQATNNAIREIKQLLTKYTISDWQVVDSYVSSGPTYEACYCVEALASNIVADLKPFLDKMDPQDRQECARIINQGY